MSETSSKLRDRNKVRTYYQYESLRPIRKDRKLQAGEDTATMSETLGKLRDWNKVRT